MSDTLETFYLKKLNKLDQFTVNRKNDRESVVSEIRKIKKWLMNERSLKEHRTLQAYFTHLYLTHGQIAYKLRQGMIDDIKKNIGYVRYDDSIIKYNENGEEKSMLLRQPIIQSLAFPECSQKLHSEIFDKVKIYAWYQYNDDFDVWFNHWYTNENTLQ